MSKQLWCDVQQLIQTAERSTLDAIKMEKSLLKAPRFSALTVDNTWTQRQCSPVSDSHALHMLTGLTEQNTGALPFVFLSSLCVCLVSKCSVWDRWADLMYSPAIYIHYAIFLPNYDCGRGGTEWLTLCLTIHLLLSCPLFVWLLFLPLSFWISLCRCSFLFVSVIITCCPACWTKVCLRGTHQLGYCLRVNKRPERIPRSGQSCGLCWSFSCMHTLYSYSHTEPGDESYAGETHRTLDVGEVHRAEDGRGGIRRVMR